MHSLCTHTCINVLMYYIIHLHVLCMYMYQFFLYYSFRVSLLDDDKADKKEGEVSVVYYATLPSSILHYCVRVHRPCSVRTGVNS